MDEKLQYNSPLVYQRADPYVLYKDGMYYFTGSIPQYDLIELRRANTLDGLTFANSKIIWRRHKSGSSPRISGRRRYILSMGNGIYISPRTAMTISGRYARTRLCARAIR